MSRLKLGEILIKQGVITEDQLNAAIKAQQKTKERIGEILLKSGTITEGDMALALGTQLGIPYYSPENLDLLKSNLDQNLDKIVPIDFAKKNNVLPLALNLNSLTCAVSDPLDLLMLDNLRRITGCDINLVVATKTDIDHEINNFYFSENKASGKTSMLNQAVESSYLQTEEPSFVTAPQTQGSATAELSLDKLIEKAGEAPVIKL